jgi:tetratricopeptide (TPR) repeat protein
VVLREAVDLNPDYWLARQNLAFALEMQGRLEEAVEQHRAALTVIEQRGPYVEEQIAPAAAALGRDLALLGRYEEAYVYLEIAAERRPDDAALRAAIVEVQRRRAAAGSTQPSGPP